MSGPGFSVLSHLECSRCGHRHDAEVLQNLCEACASPLLARYDLSALDGPAWWASVATRAPDLWRYHELLPVRDAANVVSLGEGFTPLLPAAGFGAGIGVPGLLVKDDGLLPTGSFKARGAAVGVSRARELGATGVALPTNGNAGSAWAAYAARAGLRSRIVMPRSAPSITRKECSVVGSDVDVIDGLIGDAGAIVARELAAADRGDGWFDAGTLREPYRIEGKKTMGLELAEQLGGRAPDVVVYPTGGGVGLIGIHKALGELRELGVLTGPLPKMVSVQATGCAPIVRAFEEGAAESTAWADAKTVAFGITVPKALGDFLVLDAVRSTGGTAVAVDDAELLRVQAEFARAEGLFVCPEGAAALAAVQQLRGTGWLTGDEQVVVLNTGAGLKYPETVP
ncbi:threonine synthase [Jiangella mangrovi]|uniref:Threonine synthase n=1 Tax=Jiangella mangrovi TaxID=1524084 RepID=A0A7W9LKW9_9ACTN|nr:threonine synthase [Jiangella mangrovi]